jgi:hypothetical protein
MDSGWVAAIASIASAVIVAATALAAFGQLRHNRNANDIVVYMRFIDTMDSPEMSEARAALAMLATKVQNDAQFRERLKDATFAPEEFVRIGFLLRYLEHVSLLIARGGIAEHLVLAEYADNFVLIWELMRPAIILRRSAFGPHTGRAFEHLAMRSRRYIDSGQMEREYAALERDSTPLTPPPPA